MTPPRVLVVGDVAVDVVARPSGAVAVDGDTAAAVALRGGGGGANAAVWLRRAGATPSLVGRVGEDPAGAWLREDLVAAGVDVHLAVDPDRPTAAVVAILEEGGRTMLSDRGAAGALAPTDVPAALLASVDAVLLSGYVLIGDASRAAGVAVLDGARARGVPVALDPSWATGLPPLRAEFREWLRAVEWVLPNAAEATALTGAPDAAAATRELADLAGEVALTDGPRPAWWSDGGEPVPVTPPARQVPGDPVGAGDAFSAGFLVARIGGSSGPRAVGAGQALAGRALAVVGGR